MQQKLNSEAFVIRSKSDSIVFVASIFTDGPRVAALLIIPAACSSSRPDDSAPWSDNEAIHKKP
jgi:hypothetical protein